jgi:hypothetical protein
MHKKSSMKCSVCANEIEEKYCSNCGQHFKNKRITGSSILGDLFNSVFSLEKSFFKNMKIALFQPKMLISNYWSGFRGYYYSPGRFFTIASLFILLHYLFANDFLGITVTSTLSTQFVILFFNIFLLTFLSFVIYIKYKKNFYEHLILNIYHVSFWSIIFVPISITLNIFNTNNTTEQFFFLPYHLLIIIWNSKVFEMNKIKRFVYVFLNLILLYGIMLLLIYNFGEF